LEELRDFAYRRRVAAAHGGHRDDVSVEKLHPIVGLEDTHLGHAVILLHRKPARADDRYHGDNVVTAGELGKFGRVQRYVVFVPRRQNCLGNNPACGSAHLMPSVAPIFLR
jgi:hypothetical protein